MIFHKSPLLFMVMVITSVEMLAHITTYRLCKWSIQIEILTSKAKVNSINILIMLVYALMMVMSIRSLIIKNLTIVRNLFKQLQNLPHTR